MLREGYIYYLEFYCRNDVICEKVWHLTKFTSFKVKWRVEYSKSNTKNFEKIAKTTERVEIFARADFFFGS